MKTIRNSMLGLWMAAMPATAAGLIDAGDAAVGKWTAVRVPGHEKPLHGVVYDKSFRPVCGMPLGAIGTGALDIESDGTLGYSSIFHDLSPRGGPLNFPLFGVEAGGKVAVLALGTTKAPDYNPAPPLPGDSQVQWAGLQEQPFATGGQDWEGFNGVWLAGPGQFPALFRAEKAAMIFAPGDIGGHTPARGDSITKVNHSWIRWAAPEDGTYGISGGVWSNFQDRSCDFVLRVNGKDQVGGFQSAGDKRLTIPPTADSANPRKFAVDAVALKKGDVVEFAFATNGNAAAPSMGTFFGLRATIANGDKKWDASENWSSAKNPNGPWTYGMSTSPPRPPETPPLNLPKDMLAKNIRYFGHYPVAEMDVDSGLPVDVSVRFWSPFLPGDLRASNTPGAVFSVFIKNPTDKKQSGQVVMQFPGFEKHRTPIRHIGFPSIAAEPKPPVSKIVRREFKLPDMAGISIRDEAAREEFTIAAIRPGDREVRTGAAPGVDAARWAAVPQSLPQAEAGQSDAALAVAFEVPPGETLEIPLVLGWYAPVIDGNGTPFTGGEQLPVMYASNYKSAEDVAAWLAANHQSLFKRIAAWQAALFSDPEIPGWLASALTNIMYLYPECSQWVRDPKDPENPLGIFGMQESPRSCPQMECLPVTAISGVVPTVYFFPELVLANARKWKQYQLPNGDMPFNFGLYWNMQNPGGAGNQEVMNGGNYIAIIDRYFTATGDKEFLKEFYESAKKACEYSFNYRPAYGDAQIVAMPVPVEGRYNYREWFEDREYKGYVVHPGGYRLAQALIMKKWADLMGDKEYAATLERLVKAGREALDKHLWNGKFYHASFEPESNYHLDIWFTPQLNGQIYSRGSGVGSAFAEERVASILDQLPKVVALSKLGIPPNMANADFTPFSEKYENNVIGAGYLSGPYLFIPHQTYMIADVALWEGRTKLGLDILKAHEDNTYQRWGNGWEAWNAASKTADNGERSYGMDYSHNICLWNTPAALKRQDIAGPLKPGGLVDRILKAADAGKPDAEGQAK